jgi:hypothetical protein
LSRDRPGAILRVVFFFLLTMPAAITGATAYAQTPTHEHVFAYVGELGSRHTLLAWGTTRGSGNTIGRGAKSPGKAAVRINDRTFETDSPWMRVESLLPDTEYPYTISLNGQQIASGTVRTWAEHAKSLSFLVFGDWGNASTEQRAIADAMLHVVKQRRGSASPIRFVLSTGDNIYSTIPGVLLTGSGDRDSHWEPRFFIPYRQILASIPFYAVLGNHDGNESEKRKDLDVYLDNFFFPGNVPARWYAFNYGGLADFIALDSTTNTASGRKRPAWSKDGEQHQWLQKALAQSKAPWKVAYIHHPPFNAGPRHQAEKNFERFSHFLDLFEKYGVQTVFSGHEHNFQMSERSPLTRGIRFFVSGAGGELRDKDLTTMLPGSGIEAFAAHNHFLLVDIEGDDMRVTPLGASRITPVRASGEALPLPILVKLR